MTAHRWFGERRGVLILAATAFVVLACLVAVLTLGRDRSGGSVAAPPAQNATTAQATAGSTLPRSEPATVEIPKIGAESSLAPLGLNPDGTLEVPPVSQPLQAGWYSVGPAPGEVGPAVLVGHVDGNRQKGIFYRLRELAPGDRVLVSRKDGSRLTFVVSRVVEIDKDEFPTNAVYGDTNDPELRLITCGGSFDRSVHSYRDNIIVYAALP